MKNILILFIMILSLGTSFSQEKVLYNQVDSTYILDASTAGKLAFLAEKGLYVDTLINLNNQLYGIIQEQNQELSDVYTNFDNYKLDSESYNKIVLSTKQEKLDFYEKKYKSNKKWKWVWAIASVVLTGILVTH